MLLPKITNNQINRLHRIAEQEEWIEDHGGDLAGYIARYEGHGNGGAAIYAADLAQLAAVVRGGSPPPQPMPTVSAQFRNKNRD